MAQFWSFIWAARVSRRIMYFMWMIAHAGLAVGTWAAQMGHDPTCLRCDLQLAESPRHCLWTCPSARLIWPSICLLLTRIGVQDGFVSWGAVSWLSQFASSHLFFEGEDSDPIFMLTGAGYYRGTLDLLPLSLHDFSIHPREPIFSSVASISLWCIWKVRCSHVLSAETSSSSETLCMIWTELIHTLRSQWDSSAGSSRTQERHRLEFIRHWGRTSLFFSHTSGSVTWHYAPPEWFLLHSSYQPP